MFNRRAVEDIKAWFNDPRRKPLVIRGARQVGKTTAVRMAGQQLGVKVIEINLERHTELAPLFDHFKLEELLFSISLIAGETLTQHSQQILFLDEAQAIPSAYACLRYFREEMPELAVILTGSLLDQVLNDARFSFPVGRIESYFMGPLRFDEFLQATDAQKALMNVERLAPENFHLVPDSVHAELMAQVHRYVLTGGMPYCVQLNLETGFNHAGILKHQVELIQSYKEDFAKYTGTQSASVLSAYFNSILRQVGLQFSHKQAHEITLHASGDNRKLNAAIEQFLAARLFYRVLHTHADRIPLGAGIKIRISKFLFVDVGLLLAAQGMQPRLVTQTPLELAGHGVLAEQFLGQQLLYAKAGYVSPELFYWHPPKSEGQAEVNFLYPCADRAYPVEVKSGKSGSIKSLQSYVLKKRCGLAVRFSSAKPSIQSLTAKQGTAEHKFELLNLPFYMANQLERLLSSKGI